MTTALLLYLAMFVLLAALMAWRTPWYNARETFLFGIFWPFVLLVAANMARCWAWRACRARWAK